MTKQPPGLYVGGWTDGTLSAHGQEILKTGTEKEAFKVYTGMFNRGVKSGVGKYEDPKTCIMGNFLDGEAFGFCQVEDKEKGTITQGSFKNGTVNGFGSLKSKDQEYSFEGQFAVNVFEGRGLETIRGSSYCGEFSNGLRHGTGTFQEGGHSFVGGWLQGEKHGFGIEKFANKDVFQGEYQKGIKSGPGRYIHAADEGVYVGYFEEGLKHGMGRLDFKSGDYFVGQWAKGFREGLGFEYSQGRIYYGLWKKNRKTGYGIMFYENYDYRGDWLNDRPHGKGCYLAENGIIKYGEFMNGILMEIIKEVHEESLERADPEGHLPFSYVDEDDYQEFLSKSNRQISAIDTTIKGHIRNMSAHPMNFRQEISLKKQNLKSYMKELMNRVENTLMIANSKVEEVYSLVEEAKLTYLLDEWKYNQGFGQESRQLRATEVRGGRTQSSRRGQLRHREGEVEELLVRQGVERDRFRGRGISSRPLNRRGNVANLKQLNNDMQRKSQDLNDLNIRVNAIFNREFEAISETKLLQEERQQESPPVQAKITRTRLKEDVVSGKPQTSKNQSTWDENPPVLNKKTSTGSLEAANKTVNSASEEKAEVKEASIEERERLLYVNKLSLKKQRDETLLLIDELQQLKEQIKKEKDEFNHAKIQAAEDEAKKISVARKSIQDERPLTGTGNLQNSAKKPSESEGPLIGLPEDPFHPPLTRYSLLEGDEFSRLLYFPENQEVVLSHELSIKRYRLEKGTDKAKLVSSVKIDELDPQELSQDGTVPTPERICHLWQMEGRYAAVTEPDFGIYFFDLQDRCFRYHLPGILCII